MSKRLQASIRAAKPYAEGRPVRIVVTGEEDLCGVEELLAVKLDPARGGKPSCAYRTTWAQMVAGRSRPSSMHASASS